MVAVIALGECMGELRLSEPGVAEIGYAGDTFNTAVYLRRLGLETAYASAVGRDDPISLGIMSLLAREGVNASLMIQADGRLPGLYAIACDAEGERSFFFWRSEAPARDYLALVDLERLSTALKASDLIVVSAIGLAIIGEAGRARLVELLADASGVGVAVAFDTNYRARLWPDAAAARSAIEAVLPYCRYLSLSTDDVAAFASGDPTALARAWAARGLEVVLRWGDGRIEVLVGDAVEVFGAEASLRALDTTGAGDSFNAGYLATRLRGGSVSEAVAAGRRLAAEVVQHPGAIIPLAAMPKV